jgi:S-methylmethionine-dependent homocysteine/selenocysteine methylase
MTFDAFLSKADDLILTDGGIETMLIFDDHQELPHFAAFHLLRDDAGRKALRRYYERFIAVAAAERRPFILESPTWRANPDWADKLGYAKPDLAAANRAAIRLMTELRAKHEAPRSPMLISGCVGPRGDGYVASALMRPEAAEAYHDEQIAVMADAGAEIITAITMTNAAEATGVARAALRRKLPNVISFTVETDGRLPSGQALSDAIADVDAATGSAPRWYMINCAHPTHFESVIAGGAPWTRRIGGIRANASCMSHAELNESPTLDRGDPDDLARRYARLRAMLPNLRVLGGCCGTDPAHIAAIARACAEQKAVTAA